MLVLPLPKLGSEMNQPRSLPSIYPRSSNLLNPLPISYKKEDESQALSRLDLLEASSLQP
jgi:hypothetical protein